jgi:hypothetical protein
MKQQFLGIFFYLLYLLAMVRPIVPLIEYYANYDYIATVLCENRDKPYLECNGKCYLEKQLNKVNHTDHDHKSTIPQIDLEKYPIAPIIYYSYDFKKINNHSSKRLFVSKYTLQEVYRSLLKPPQFYYYS